MKVFVSWSGQVSRDVARNLKKWIPRILQDVELFVSDLDIKAGERWSHTIGTELSDRHCAIVCLTPENADSAWLNFEAGAVSKLISESLVMPFLFKISISNIDGPLTQFQAKNADREGYLDLVISVNHASDRQRNEQEITEIFDLFWPQIVDDLDDIDVSKIGEEGSRDVSSVLDDVIFSVNDMREQIAAIEGRLNPASSPRARIELIANFFLSAKNTTDKKVLRAVSSFCEGEINSIFAERVLSEDERAYAKKLRSDFAQNKE